VKAPEAVDDKQRVLTKLQPWKTHRKNLFLSKTNVDAATALDDSK
jgi:hypothetical protein